MTENAGFLNTGHPLGVVFHSDRGSVDTSQAVEERADAHGVTLSCGEVGTAWDSAAA